MAKQNVKKRITDKKLKRFYKLLSVPMIDFDCGNLCAPKNNGIPVCCENEDVVPVLFHEEYKYHSRNGGFWKRASTKNKEIKKFIEESEDYYVFSQCPGPGGCIRTKRSLNCMTFPFEPHVAKDGKVVGLAFADARDVNCPLIGKPWKTFNPLFIKNCMEFWEEIFELYPEEKEMYIEESKKRERKVRQLKERRKRLGVFRKNK